MKIISRDVCLAKYRESIVRPFSLRLSLGRRQADRLAKGPQRVTWKLPKAACKRLPSAICNFGCKIVLPVPGASFRTGFGPVRAVNLDQEPCQDRRRKPGTGTGSTIKQVFAARARRPAPLEAESPDQGETADEEEAATTVASSRQGSAFGASFLVPAALASEVASCGLPSF